VAYWGVAREQRIPITAAFNGAELLKAEHERVSVSARSLPQWVRYRCGLPAALMANGNVEPRDLGVRRALERHTITFTVTPEEYAALRDQASLPNGPGSRCRSTSGRDVDSACAMSRTPTRQIVTQKRTRRGRCWINLG